ncbi:pentatricopeptide repeat-containing protein At1g74600, chloroplastic-like isoform X2 [Nymphaea colorata]|uniref:pentatricopeptide repeat-containing protein At1g74600, chloroplastic-like isoform X2 n=1 Tax=Nymphaea colorata TaxID=210225 RepID=UPI00129ED00E|nr:pentatricopeptide repeat-containing protein At1g74600, chloroplastic-like isoform X2 [Nymphaea colorata]
MPFHQSLSLRTRRKPLHSFLPTSVSKAHEAFGRVSRWISGSTFNFLPSESIPTGCHFLQSNVLRIHRSAHFSNSSISSFLICRYNHVALPLSVETHHPNFASRRALTPGFVYDSQFEELWCLLCRIRLAGSIPDAFVYCRLLSACSLHRSWQRGLQVFVHIIKFGYLSNLYVATSLIDFLAKNASFDDIMWAFYDIPHRNVVLWNAVIAGSVRHKESWVALSLFKSMLYDSHYVPNSFSLSSVLTACAGIEELDLGRSIHVWIIKCNLLDDVFVATGLVDMYAKCGSMVDALVEFQRMPERNVVSWTAVISGYIRQGDAVSAFEFFNNMRTFGVGANIYTLTSTVVSEALINAYAKCGNIELCEKVFHEERVSGDKISISLFSAMLAGYAQSQNSGRSIWLFQQILHEGMRPDKYATSSVLSVVDVEELGKQIHSFAVKTGLSCDVSVASSISTVYSKCGSLDEAFQLFEGAVERDVVFWTSMIAGFADHGQPEKAFELVRKMQFEGLNPDVFTLSALLTACSVCKSLRKGKEIHGFALHFAMEGQNLVGSSLVNMYSKCGDTVSSFRVFNRMPEKDHFSWSSLISGLAQNGYCEEALMQFHEMLKDGLKIDSFVVSSLLGVLSSLTYVELGKQFHAQTIKTGLEFDLTVGSSLVTMYSKCGNIEDSRKVFDLLCATDVVSWTAIIAGYAHNGQGLEALQMFEQMLEKDIEPDAVTFVGVLTACSHNGLTEAAYGYLDSMEKDYSIKPGIPHYACMVDVLGRSGRLEEAVKFIDAMPLKPDALVWGTLLGACRLYENVELGKLVANKVLELAPSDSGAYVSLSNMSAKIGNWGDVTMIRNLMNDFGIQKEPGWSSV